MRAGEGGMGSHETDRPDGNARGFVIEEFEDVKNEIFHKLGISRGSAVNQDKDLLGLELRLLIARYGKAKINEVLSSMEDIGLATLDADVRAYEGRTRRNKARPRSRKSIDEMIQEANPENPDAEHLIRKLAFAYKDRQFLPDLREVKRFLEFRRTSAVKFDSRADALPAVIRVLAQTEPDELATLVERKATRGSDLGIIANQILGRGNGSSTRV